MQPRTFILGALAAMAYADDDNCSKSVNVTSQADLDKVAGCKKLKGDITIVGGGADLVINGIQEIDGSLIANNLTDLSSLSAPSLETIDD